MGPQHPVGRYVVDFTCLEAGLVVELDGGQQAISDVDVLRTGFLEAAGFHVLRFWNNDGLADTDAVLEAVYQALGEERPHPSPLPQAGEGA